MKERCTLYIQATLISTLIALLLSCGGDNGVDPPGDTTRPTVISVTPSDNSTNISVDTQIEVIFSELIDSVTSELIVRNNSSQISGVTSLNDSILTFTPSVDLSYETEYTIVLPPTLEDLAGNKLADSVKTSFTTEPDPTTSPPTILATSPVNNASDIPIDAVVTITFSKAMDAATITSLSITMNNNVTGTVSYNPTGFIATFNPDTDLEYDSLYTVTVTTDVADTFGNNLAAEYNFSFSTQTLTPALTTLTPDQDSVIVGQTTEFSYLVSHPLGIDSIQLVVDGFVDSTIIGNSTLYQFSWDGTGYGIGSEHNLYARAFDGMGNVGYSDTITVYYQWKLLISDGIDGMDPIDAYQNITNLYSRSNDTLLEFRITYYRQVIADPYLDTDINLAIYLDIDNNVTTGFTGNTGIGTINGLGAEFRILYGIYSREDSLLCRYNTSLDPPWEPVKDTSQISYINYSVDSFFVEIGILWSDLENTDSVSFVNINFVTDTTGSVIYFDWVPDEDNGYLTVYNDRKYIGPVLPTQDKLFYNRQSALFQYLRKTINPFN